MRPYSLDAFAMRHADLVHESEIEGGLTGCAVTNKMELRNGDMNTGGKGAWKSTKTC